MVVPIEKILNPSSRYLVAILSELNPR
jgi:hypothetical protein